MLTKNAIKTLSKYGNVEETHSGFITVIGDQYVEVNTYGKDEVSSIRVVGLDDTDDSQSDYCAGTWMPNLKQAIECCV
jgi:hypothetical protein